MQSAYNLPSRHQSDYTSRRSKRRSVESTAAPNADSQLRAVDATACREQIAKLAAVAIPAARNKSQIYHCDCAHRPMYFNFPGRCKSKSV
jgi:hypothetical protein